MSASLSQQRVLWSAVAGAAAILASARRPALNWRLAVLVAAAVFSHWVLDALVHRPEMPLTGAGSHVVGFALWNTMSVALGIEATIVAIGLYLFVAGSRLPRGKSIALTVLTLVVLALTVAGMTIAPPPPSALAMAGSSLVTLGAVFGIYGWLGRHPRAG